MNTTYSTQHIVRRFDRRIRFGLVLTVLLGFWLAPGYAAHAAKHTPSVSHAPTAPVATLAADQAASIDTTVRLSSTTATTPTVTITPSSAAPGTTLSIQGSGFAPIDGIGGLRWNDSDSSAVTIAADGSLAATWVVPEAAQTGQATITICNTSPCAIGEAAQQVTTTIQITRPPTLYLPFAQAGNPATPPPPFSYRVDASVQPAPIVLPPLAGAARPLAAVAAPNGQVSTFVANELVVQSNDRSQVDALLARYAGTLLQEVVPAAGTETLTRTYLLRLNVASADLTRFVANVAALDGVNGEASGEHRFSSEDATKLLALTAAEARNGLGVSVNWVGQSGAIPDTSNEAPNGPAFGGVPFNPNAYSWPYMARGTPQDIGVAPAWSLLHFSGRLSNRVRIAILDKGFAPNDDFPAAVTFGSVIPGIGDPRGVRGDAASPWHGTSVFGTAMGRHDNNRGVAGVAAPIAEPILIYTGYDYITSIAALVLARAQGAKVINMSYSADIPAAFGWTALPFDATSAIVRASGTLLFASAGNDGNNVDGEDCFIVCWEETYVVPCESPGVICVGGNAWNSRLRDRDSNFGTRGDVQMFAPFTVYEGATPDNPTGTTTLGLINGTSFASPFTAGVAGLVWAANPSLSADQVWAIMRDTAHPGLESRVPRTINAHRAVLRALGAAVSVNITNPRNGQTLEVGVPFSAASSVHYVADRGGLPLRMQWIKQSDGRVLGESNLTPGVGSHTFFFAPIIRDLEVGSQTLILRATISGLPTGNMVVEQRVTITVRNSPPQPRIISPENGASFCPAATIVFRGEASDINQPTGLPAGAFAWSSNINGTLGTGPDLDVSTLSSGNHTISLRVTDSGGLAETVTRNITIRSAIDPICSNVAPSARITAPPNGTTEFVTDSDSRGWYRTFTFVGQVSDVEDAEPSLAVVWSSNLDGELGRSTPNASGRVELTARLYVQPADLCGFSRHTITLRVTDSQGNVTVDRIQVTVLPGPC
jgi:hypothetical protein